MHVVQYKYFDTTFAGRAIAKRPPVRHGLDLSNFNIIWAQKVLGKLYLDV